MKISLEMTETYRSEFEESAPKHLDYSKNDAGDYLNQTTNAYWHGFILAKNDNGPIKRHFIIGKLNEYQFPRFSNKPRVHGSKVSAVKEAVRLSSITDNAFGMYQLVDVFRCGESLTTFTYTIYWKDGFRRTVLKGKSINSALEKAGYVGVSIEDDIAWYDTSAHNKPTNLYKLIWIDGTETIVSALGKRQAMYAGAKTKYPELTNTRDIKFKMYSCKCINSDTVMSMGVRVTATTSSDSSESDASDLVLGATTPCNSISNLGESLLLSSFDTLETYEENNPDQQ